MAIEHSENDLLYTSILTLQESSISLDKIACGTCRSVNEFEKVRRLGEGTYGIVYEGIDKKNKEKVALKLIRFESERNTEGVSISVIREIYALLELPQHENIVRLFDVVVGRKLRKIFIIMEYCDQDLATLLDNMQNPFTESQIKCLLLQLFRGLAHLHSSFILHRDIKVSNLLLTHRGILKIADFGLSRFFGDPFIKMTSHVVTLWYRSPELLLNSKYQSTSIDMWACGCIMSELILHKPLLPGNSELDQLRKIINLLGTPNERIWPGMTDLKQLSNLKLYHQPFNNIRVVFPDASAETISLLNRLFAYDPQRRATAEECLKSDYFNVSPLPCDPSLMPSLSSLTKRSSRKRPAIDFSTEI